MDGNYNIEAEDFNAEDKIATSKISGITSLMLVGKNISNLAGIEDFTSLSELNADFNQLTSLDVSKNTALTDLLVNENKLTSLDVSKNIALIDLEVNSNQLTSLDVSNNTALTYLFVKNNKLTSLDVSNNIALTKLETKNNQLTNLDVSNNIALTKLETKNNQLTNLDVSNNTALTYLYVNNNLLTSLDLSNNTALTGLKVNDNPDLTCIQVNQTQLDNIPSDWQKDDTQNFSLDCSDVWVVNTADTQLDNALAAVTGLDTNNDGKITLAEAAAYTGVLDLKGKGLTNTDGLEAFTGASKIDLSNNQITNIDKLTDATEVEVVSKSGAKRTEKRAENKLETLDVSNNLIEKIDISKMKSLTSLIVSNNSLTKLILSNGNNAILTNMNATNNANLSCIQVDNVANALANGNWLKPTTVSYSTNCSAALGVTNETLLKHIAIYPNPVKSVLNITTNNGLSINNIEIYSMLGTRIVQTATQQINTKNLASGMYLLKIVTNNGIATSRFVKE
ncbi:MAG: T9SS type A sorting domain-containing protein [Polaribacter sp.]